MALYVGVILVTGDIGGPLNFLILPVLFGFLAGGASAFLIAPLNWIGKRWRIRRTVVALGLLPALTLIVWSPGIWFYGFAAEVTSPPRTLLVMAGVIYVYLLIGLLAQYGCKWLLGGTPSQRALVAG